MSKVTDNVELDFPARMSDGRQFTDYRQNCLLLKPMNALFFVIIHIRSEAPWRSMMRVLWRNHFIVSNFLITNLKKHTCLSERKVGA